MTSQVFYRKWRPKTFAQVTGQEHVTAVLKQAVAGGHISHAYLFCGPRGTGKTTTARVLAKALNCQHPIDGEPDAACPICLSTDAGRFMDLIEMDAASNRGIDEIRGIREKVNFSPTEGKFKVYIVDEAHMLTDAASNAFLKTLEEPPPHVIFVLCTTEPHDLLPTITSRCQRFDFRRLSSDVIAAKLKFICDQESIDADPKALLALARAANGGLRDAENLLEQIAVSYDHKVTQEAIQEVLGLGHSQTAKDLVGYLLSANSAAALGAIARAAQDGADIRALHRQSLELLRAVLMVQSGAAETLDLEADTLRDVQALAGKTHINRAMKCLKALGQVNMKLDVGSSLPLELAVIEASTETPAGRGPGVATPSAEGSASRPMAPRPTAPSPSYPRPSNPSGRGPSAASTERSPYSGAVEEPNTSRSTTYSRPTSQTPAPQPPQPRPTRPEPPHGMENGAASLPSMSRPPVPANPNQVPETAWTQVVQALKRHKGRRFVIGPLLRGCRTPYIDNDVMVLPFMHRTIMENLQSEMEDPLTRDAMSKAVAQSFGRSYELRITLLGGDAGDGRPASATSHLVRAARALGGKIIEERKAGNDEQAIS